MADVFTKKKRSEIMSRIRSKNTGIEKTVFSYLRKHQIYFYRHYDNIKGKPDIALPAKKIAIFINGDFWHGYRFFSWKSRIPRKYWRDKIETNIERDRKLYSSMRRQGWKVMRVWGHELKKYPEETCARIAVFLGS